MPRIYPANPEQMDPETRATLEQVKSTLGMVPNLFATFAHSPAVLDAYLGLSDTLATGRLSSTQREIIALAVAQENNCHYCLAAHSAVAGGLGMDSTEIAQARRGAAGNNLDNALASLAAHMVAQSGRLSEEELMSAREAGVDRELLLELIANVAQNVLTNYTNHIAGTEIDFPPVSAEIQTA